MSTLVQHKTNETNANQNTVAITVASTGAAALIVVSAANNGGMTVTGVADNIGNTYLQIAGAQSDRDGGGGGKADIWRCLSATAGVTLITITFSATTTNFKFGEAWEVSGLTGAAEDGAAVVNAQTSSANTSNGASLNTSSTDGFVVGILVTGGGVTANPKAGNEFTSGGDIGAATLWAGCSLISTTAAAHKPVWSDSTGVLFCASTAAFKASGGSTVTGSETETGAASDSVGGTLVDGGTISEAGAAVDAVTGALVDGGTISETLTATDTVSGPVADRGDITETLASSDAVGATVIPAGSAVENLAAIDVVASPAAQLGGSIAEGGALIDAVDATGGQQVIIPVDQPSTAPGLGGGGDPGRKKKRVRPVGKRRYLNHDGTITDRPGQADIGTARISPPSNVVQFQRVEKEQEPDVIYADLDADEMEAVMQLVVNG